jgi:hypothetical protein
LELGLHRQNQRARERCDKAAQDVAEADPAARLTSALEGTDGTGGQVGWIHGGRS